jgi:3-hydroxyacyl-[acyl-carrier-protein] dehydratase
MQKALLGIDEIRRLLAHRYPILLVDRVLELTDRELLAQKLVSANEPFLQGHFPTLPIMPGVLILEALAQSAGIWLMRSNPETRSLMPVLTGIDRARFRRPVRPGDVLALHVRIDRARKSVIRFEGTASVDGETAAEAIMLANLVDWSMEGA